MNTTKKVDREKWIDHAKRTIRMDADERVTNRFDVVQSLMLEYGISKSSAITAMANAARRLRGRP